MCVCFIVVYIMLGKKVLKREVSTLAQIFASFFFLMLWPMTKIVLTIYSVALCG